MEKHARHTKIVIGHRGRLAIPPEIRRALDIAPGDVLIAIVEDQRLVLETRGAVLQRVRRRFAHIPAELSLVNELIAERRAESAVACSLQTPLP